MILPILLVGLTLTGYPALRGLLSSRQDKMPYHSWVPILVPVYLTLTAFGWLAFVFERARS